MKTWGGLRAAPSQSQGNSSGRRKMKNVVTVMIVLLSLACTMVPTRTNESGHHVSTHVSDIEECDAVTIEEDAWDGQVTIALEPMNLTPVDGSASGMYRLGLACFVNADQGTGRYVLYVYYSGDSWTFLYPEGSLSLRMSDGQVSTWDFDDPDRRQTTVSQYGNGVYETCWLSIGPDVLNAMADGVVDMYRITSDRSVVNLVLQEWDLEQMNEFRSACDSLIAPRAGGLN